MEYEDKIQFPVLDAPVAGVKHDTEKPPMHLVAWDAVGEALTSGLHLRTMSNLRDWWSGAPREALASALYRLLYLAGRGNASRGLLEVARVLDFGARKYAPRNWERGLAHSRTFAAAQRHLCARAGGEVLDPETGLDHYAHAACEIMFALAFEVRGRTDLDDRPKL